MTIDAEPYPSYEDLNAYKGESTVRKDFSALLDTLSAHILACNAFVDYIRQESSNGEEVISATTYLSRKEYDDFESTHPEFLQLKEKRDAFAKELGLSVFEVRSEVSTDGFFNPDFDTLKAEFFAHV